MIVCVGFGHDQKFGIICSILRISVIIQKHTQLELREISFDDSSEGFVLVRQKHYRNLAFCLFNFEFMV